MSKDNDSYEMQLTDAFLKMCGITYGETYINFDEHKYQLRDYEPIENHIDALVAALKKISDDKMTVNVISSSSDRHCIYVNDTKVAEYRKSWFGYWKCKRSEMLRMEIETIRFGQFIFGLMGCVANTVLKMA